MEGKELLKLLDYVKTLWTNAEESERKSKDATDESKIALYKAEVIVYKKVADKLDEILRDLNRP